MPDFSDLTRGGRTPDATLQLVDGLQADRARLTALISPPDPVIKAAMAGERVDQQEAQVAFDLLRIRNRARMEIDATIDELLGNTDSRVLRLVRGEGPA